MFIANFLTNINMSKQNLKNIAAGAAAGAVSAVIVLFAASIFWHGSFIMENGSKDFFKNFSSSISHLKDDKNLSKNYISQEDLVIAAVKKAQPAVISVIITKDVPILEQYYDDSSNDLFGDFFGSSPFSFQFPKYRENGTEKKEVGGGSGFIVSSDGYIITNKHVVSDAAAEYTVFLNDGTKYIAQVLAQDPSNDIAILKIDAKDLPYLEFGDSDNLLAGQTAIAIGNPLLQFNNSVSVGVISGLSRSIIAGDGFGKSEQLEGVIQTDAAINPGNSGGPLLNLKGEVIGVNVAVASAENIGFSLPANLVKNAYESVKEHGKIIRPYLGIRYIQINEKLKESNKLAVDYGVLISRGQNAEELAVMPGSPADKAGLLENDIILETDGVELKEDSKSLSRIVAEKEAGSTLKLKILSKGKEKTISVNLEEMP